MTYDLWLPLVLGWGAAVALWLLATNRLLGQLPDGPAKGAAIGGVLFVTLAGATGWALARGATAMAVAVPTLVLFLLGVGEGYRLALRRAYRASPPLAVSGAPGGLLRPVTTTALVARQYEVPMPGLPLERLRVAHLSDLHVSADFSLAYYHGAFALAASYEPDVLLMTGDFVWRAEDLPLLRAALAQLPRPPGGVYAVLGNHDHWAGADGVRQVLSDAHVTLLHERCCALGLVGGRDVVLCGEERPWGPRPEPYPADSTLIALSHTPDNVYELAAGGVGVVFSGHLHGGQVRLPGLGAVVSPSRYGRRFTSGHFLVEGTHLFVSSGVGGIPFRLWCQPDILVVDLVAGADAECRQWIRRPSSACRVEAA